MEGVQPAQRIPPAADGQSVGTGEPCPWELNGCHSVGGGSRRGAAETTLETVRASPMAVRGPSMRFRAGADPFRSRGKSQEDSKPMTSLAGDRKRASQLEPR